MRFVLTTDQLNGLKGHVYRSQGTSILEALVLKRFWRWLVTFLPFSIAPNLITFTGFIIAMVSSLCVLLPDLNAEGKVRERGRGRGREREGEGEGRGRGGGGGGGGVEGESESEEIVCMYFIVGTTMDLSILCCRSIHISDTGWYGW